MGRLREAERERESERARERESESERESEAPAAQTVVGGEWGADLMWRARSLTRKASGGCPSLLAGQPLPL